MIPFEGRSFTACSNSIGEGQPWATQSYENTSCCVRGMSCAAMDQFSYAEVKATSRKLTIAPKDSAGRLVREPTGKRCGPFTVKRR